MSQGRHHGTSARAIGVMAAAFVLAGSPAFAQTTSGDPVRVEKPPSRELAISRIEFEGLSRTARAQADRAAGLELPAPATTDVIREAARRLRESGYFRAVDVSTRPGERPGDVVVVFQVQESHPELRFGLGFEDYSGWYLIPVELNADNLTGHGEGLSLGARIGYRVAGLDLTLRRPGRLSARDFWEVKVRAEGVDRIYFLDSTETRHHLGRGAIDLRVGHRLRGPLAFETWVGADGTVADSNATLYTDRASIGKERGDDVPFDQLPTEIQNDVGERGQGRLGLALIADGRSGPGGLRMRGTWARLSAEAAFSELGDVGSWQADVRSYAPIGSNAQLAARLRAGACSYSAPFYSRYYVGGIYTVRGYASQSLSPPEGDLNFGAGSLELRHAWVGPAENPRFSGLAFVDAAVGWSEAAPSSDDLAWGAGVGFRVPLPWFGQVGLDAGLPLSPSQLDESFHLHGSLGWSF